MSDIEDIKKRAFNELLTKKFETNLINFLLHDVDLTKIKLEIEKKKIEEKNPKKKATKKKSRKSQEKVKKPKKTDEEKRKSAEYQDLNRREQLLT